MGLPANASSAVPVPRGPEDLTTDWLNRVLTRGSGEGGALTGFEVEELGPGRGVASRVVRVRLAYRETESPGPGSLIAKFPAQNTGTRRLADLLSLYEREIRFYEQLAPRVSLPTPAAYYSRIDPATGDFVLLLEDVAPAVEGDLEAGCDLDRAEEVIAALGELHAQWWSSDHLAACAWLPPADYVTALDLGSAVREDPWAAFLRQHGRNLPPAIQRLGARLRHDRSVLGRLASPPLTLVHGDFRVSNMMFTGPGRRLRAVVDWQTAVRGRGPMDVAMFFASSLTPDDRRAAETRLLPLYHATLVRCGVSDYAYEDCWLDYCLSIANQFDQVVFLATALDLENQVPEATAAVTGQRLAAALIDLDPARLLGNRPLWSRALSRARSLLRLKATSG